MLISATPQYFAEIKRIIERIDAQPPQVMIQVLIAEVQLNNNEEFGVEFGLQSPVLFNRGGPERPRGSTSTTSRCRWDSVNASEQGNVGFQGLANLGVGRASTRVRLRRVRLLRLQPLVHLLIRALKAQGRVDILSRPQVQVTDNQAGFVQVGQNFPYLEPSTMPRDRPRPAIGRCTSKSA